MNENGVANGIKVAGGTVAVFFAGLNISLLICGLYLAFQVEKSSRPAKYEYNSVTIETKLERHPHYKSSYDNSFLVVNNSELDEYGNNGWEIVSSYTETETAFANVGSDRSILGVKSNVRSFRLTFIMKRRVESKLMFSQWLRELVSKDDSVDTVKN